MPEILNLKNVQKSFGAVKVADDLNCVVNKGEALGIIGPNGAGKTSMFNLITGNLKPDTGAIYYNGIDITGLSAAKRSHLGIARSFQVPQPFSGLTVFENALVAALHATNMNRVNAEQYCIKILEQTELISKANIVAGKLTLLERKRLELTRALCTKPKLLLLDEIAGGLTEAECASLVSTIKEVHSSGVSIVWIEHVVHALLAVVDRLVVLDFGKKIAEGEPKAIMQSPEVMETYLGIEAVA